MTSLIDFNVIAIAKNDKIFMTSFNTSKTICLHQRSRIQFFIKVICTKRYVKTNIECLHNKSCILNYKQIYLILLCCLHLKVRKLCESKLPLPKITYQYIKVVLIKSLTLESYLFESDRLNYVLHFSKLFFIPLLFTPCI